jgi:hypothetical protein
LDHATAEQLAKELESPFELVGRLLADLKAAGLGGGSNHAVMVRTGAARAA